MSRIAAIDGCLPGPWYRVVAVPGGQPGGSDRDYATVLPAALDAARRGRPLIAGWFCRGGGAPLELITNAGPPAGADGGGLAGPCELLFPWGGRGLPLGGSAIDVLDRLVWAACPGRQAPVLPGDLAGSAAGPSDDLRQPQGRQARGQLPHREGRGGPVPTLFESSLLTLMARPFGWLVVAEPTDLVEAETAELRSRLNVLRRLDEERARFDAERAMRRLAELDAFREAGLWSVRVLAGAADSRQLGLITPVLVGSADLGSHPYRLRATDQARALADALAAKAADPVDGSAVPFAATAGVLTALAGLPRQEVPGVRVLDPGYFDVTSEADAEQAVSIGTILDGQDRPVGELGVPLPTINRHALVTGATGSGKSHTVRHLLAELAGAGIPWLVIEPVKSEYAAVAGRLSAALGPDAGAVTVINPSDPAQIPIAVNPLEPEPGYPVQAHIDMVRALFLAAFDAREPFPQIIAQALQHAYESCGWDPVTGGGLPGLAAAPSVPTLTGLEAAALQVIADVGYGRELQADVRGFVSVRLRSLRTGSAGRFFEGGHPADIGGLLRRNVVLAIEDVANDEDKAFLIGTLIIRITEHLRLRARTRPADGLRHVIVIEEAHRLLRAGKEGATGHAVELFAGLLAEIRAYGEGLVIAEQIPAKLVPDAVKNTALKIVHRLPALDDRELVGATMNLDAEQSRQVVSFRPGVAAVFADGMDRPLRIRVPYGGDDERAPEPRLLLPPPLARRRSAACGPACSGSGPCTLLDMRSADLHALAPESAWLRVWTEALLLAVLTNSPQPAVPAGLGRRWAGWPARVAECALATGIDHGLRRRAGVLLAYLDPGRLAAAAAAAARRMLAGGEGAGTRAGRGWVIPQLRWLHEMERAWPLGSSPPDPGAPAPRLDYPLPGLADQPGISVGQRIGGLRRHPLSMELARNRLPAWTALLGEDDQRGFCDDLATLMVGSGHRVQLARAAAEMGIGSWLEAVLSWPRRFIAAAGGQAAGTGEP